MHGVYGDFSRYSIKLSTSFFNLYDANKSNEKRPTKTIEENNGVMASLSISYKMLHVTPIMF